MLRGPGGAGVPAVGLPGRRSPDGAGRRRRAAGDRRRRALAAIGRIGSRRARWALGGAAAAVALLLGMVLVGLPARMLLPKLGELSAEIGRPLDGIAAVPTPYEGRMSGPGSSCWRCH